MFESKLPQEYGEKLCGFYRLNRNRSEILDLHMLKFVCARQYKN